MFRRLLTLSAAVGLLALPARADDTPKPKPDPVTDNQAAKPAKDVKDPKKEGDDKKDDTKAARIAHIKLAGDLSEAPTGDSLFGAPAENLRAKLDRIRKAGKDDRIKGLYLELGDLSIGFGKMNEVRVALADFRKSGKKITAFAEEMGAKAYLVALGCDAIVLPESGGLSVYGLRAEVTYYKNTLDKLMLKADVLKMGNYKSAVEPYLTNEMSKENREQLESILGDSYDNEVVGAIVKGRPAKKFDAEQVKAIIDQGPFTAKKALELGLVDTLAYQDQIPSLFKKQLGGEEVRIVENYGKAAGREADFSNPFKLLEAFSPPKKKESKEPKIAVIYVIGGIASGKGGVNPLMGGSSVGSETIVKAIQDAEKNPTVKAIVLRIDSPGGSALASDMIWRATKTCTKPVVASMGDVAASGGYYVAMAGKKIFAEPGTVTGSIGVFGLKLVTGGLEEFAGLKTVVISKGKNSGVNSTTFAWSDSERKAMTATIEEIYDQFIDKGLEGRKAAGVDMDRAKLLSLAGGRVWTGRQAKAAGLVDELGTIDDAIAYAKTLAKIDPATEIELYQLPKGGSFLDKLADGDLGSPFGALRAIPGAEKAMKMAAPVLNTANDPVKMLMPFMIEWK